MVSFKERNISSKPFLKPFPFSSAFSMALKAVPNTVKTRNKLKNVKKKFFLMSDISTSPCEIIPCNNENPVIH